MCEDIIISKIDSILTIIEEGYKNNSIEYSLYSLLFDEVTELSCLLNIKEFNIND